MSAEAALQLTIPATALTENSIVLCTGNPYSLDQIITGLVAAGYAAVPKWTVLRNFRYEAAFWTSIRPEKARL